MPPSIKLHTTRQRRSQETLARILKACEEALQTQSFEELTVAGLCQQAGCSVGAFYARVASKEALLEHLRDKTYAELETQLGALFAPQRLPGLPFAQLLGEQCQALVELHRARRGLLRALILQARRTQAHGIPTRVFNHKLMALVAQSWLSRREEIAHPQPELAVRQAALLAAGYLREALLFAELWPEASSQEDAAPARELQRLLSAYLLTPSHEEPADVPHP